MKSMIVTPTSLTYHWLAEFKRFDDAMVVRVVSGPRERNGAAPSRRSSATRRWTWC